MKLLLDTHIFLWLIDDNKRLSAQYRQAIQDPNAAPPRTLRLLHDLTKLKNFKLIDSCQLLQLANVCLFGFSRNNPQSMNYTRKPT